jgi:DNA repair protein RecN (Recombination protein N)
VTTAFLRQLAPALADIHGQNEQQLLFDTQTQRTLLDKYGRHGDLLARVSAAYTRWRDTQRRLEDLQKNEQEKLRLLDLWRFQRNEIQALHLKVGEDEALEAERKILQNTTRLQENATAAFDLLYESPESAASVLKQATKRVDDLVRIDSNLNEICAALKQAQISVEEASWTLRDYLGKLEGDPARLEEVENRLDAIDKLKRKYGGSLEEILAFCEKVTQQVDEVENATEHQEALEKELARLGVEYEKLACELSRKRGMAAEQVSRSVENELKSLAMGGTQFQVSVKRTDWSASGMDEIEFLVSPNRGEELRPMGKIASGGELSRISLAMKTAMGDSDSRRDVHTLVFDEVDAGVGGAAAASVGRRLKALSRTNQVICVTHLAQIAGFGDHHYAVAKKERKGRVVTDISELNDVERATEIGRMLSGETITSEALKQAEQLLQAGRG